MQVRYTPHSPSPFTTIWIPICIIHLLSNFHAECISQYPRNTIRWHPEGRENKLACVELVNNTYQILGRISTKLLSPVFAVALGMQSRQRTANWCSRLIIIVSETSPHVNFPPFKWSDSGSEYSICCSGAHMARYTDPFILMPRSSLFTHGLHFVCAQTLTGVQSQCVKKSTDTSTNRNSFGSATFGRMFCLDGCHRTRMQASEVSIS